MAYLIDGHNLIGQLPDLSLADPHDEVKLVQRLKRYMMRHDKKCTVVFDKGLPGGMNPNLSNSQVEVVFAHSKTDADRIIKERIRKARDRSHWQIVSNDQDVISVARGRRMRVIASRDFAADLAAVVARTEPDDENPNPTMTPDELDYWLNEFDA